jgi:hypothetical protein
MRCIICTQSIGRPSRDRTGAQGSSVLVRNDRGAVERLTDQDGQRHSASTVAFQPNRVTGVDSVRLHALLGVNRSLMAELDPDAVLEHLLDVAREQTGAAYAAIGVLDEHKEELERFVTAGIDEAGR